MLLERGRAHTALAAMLLLCVVGHESAEAQSIALRLGWASPRVESDLWRDTFQTFALDRSDFDGLIAGVEISVPIAERVDLLVGVETTGRTTATNYRDFVREDGSEIVQEISLRLTPLTAGLKAYPAGRHRNAYPYVSGGFALHLHQYEERGEFIDFETFDIFAERFVDRGAALGGFVAVGMAVSLSARTFAFAEFRQHWAQGEHRRDFDGFGSFDAKLRQVSFGVDLRF